MCIWGRFSSKRLPRSWPPMTCSTPTGGISPLSLPYVVYSRLMSSVAEQLAARRPKIIGVGTNYRAHAAEMGKPVPDEPLLFFKPHTALLADGAPIIRPTGTWRVDFEGELGVVIGQRCRKVREADAGSVIEGYTIV